MKRGKAIFIGVLMMGWLGALPAMAIEVHGFGEAVVGFKLSDDQTKGDTVNLLEQRWQLKTTYFFEGNGYLPEKGAFVDVKGDAWVDGYFSGKTGYDLRELSFSISPLDVLDVKIGRQILTWGTGDYLFINDQFPKDYVSFFSGRDDEYLKKPSDALKLSLYPSWGNVDFIMAVFTPNSQPKGDRLSFFDMFQGGIAGLSSDRDLREPALRLSNNEYYLRYYRNIGRYEGALYYFRGFDKNPTSVWDESARQMFYRRLDVYGASLRGPVAGGIGSVEMGYSYSRQDPQGRNRLIENSMLKVLAGYSKDLGNDWSVGVQYEYDQRLDYRRYTENLLPGDFVFDEFRHLVTQSVTKLLRNQTVRLALFNYYSPSDKDGYARVSCAYDVTDQWKLTVGANLPWGEDDTTEFGQMKRNKNVYTRVRYSF